MAKSEKSWFWLFQTSKILLTSLKRSRIYFLLFWSSRPAKPNPNPKNSCRRLKIKHFNWFELINFGEKTRYFRRLDQHSTTKIGCEVDIIRQTQYCPTQPHASPKYLKSQTFIPSNKSKMADTLRYANCENVLQRWSISRSPIFYIDESSFWKFPKRAFGKG